MYSIQYKDYNFSNFEKININLCDNIYIYMWVCVYSGTNCNLTQMYDQCFAYFRAQRFFAEYNDFFAFSILFYVSHFFFL